MKECIWNLCRVSLMALFAASVLPGRGFASPFEFGRDVDALVVEAGPDGGTFQVKDRASPVDGVTVEIPPHALTETVKLHLYYNTGKFKPASGEPSGINFGIATENHLKQFEKPIKIRVRYDAKKHSQAVVVGFAIDSKGELSGLQMFSQNAKDETITFVTMVPVLFTWVYATL